MACTSADVPHGGATSTGEFGGGKSNTTYGAVGRTGGWYWMGDASADPELKGADV